MNNSLLVLILKNLVILPQQEIKIELKDKISQKIIKISQKKYNNRILVVAPLDSKELSPSVDDLPTVGVIALIKSQIELSNGNYRVTLKGEKRVKVLEYTSFSDEILLSIYKDIVLPKYDEIKEMATIKKLKNAVSKYIESSPSVSNSILKTISDVNNVNFLSDVVTSFIPLSTNKKIEYMQDVNGINRAIKLIKDISVEIKLLELDQEIDDKIDFNLSKSQEEFYLKEKISEIKKMLGETSYKADEVKRYKERIEEISLSKTSYEKIAGEIEKFEYASDTSPESSVIKNYLEWVLYLPWNKKSEEELNSKKVLSSLNNSHYGLLEVKERIMDYVMIKKLNPEITSPVICLVGPPGVGKTTIASSIAKSLNREFAKINVGGLNDSNELVGNRRTYLGALPGKIIQAIKKCDTMNPVILIDEVDKMVKDYKGDPASTLLDILDNTQNNKFTDNYIEEPFDLSNVLFILTANDTSSMPLPLVDRVEIIELNSYTLFEKIDIAKKYLIPTICKEYKVTNKLKIKDQHLGLIIESYTNEAGVRNLSRLLSKLIRKSIMNDIAVIDEELIKQYLGEPLYDVTKARDNKVGVVNGLAYTSNGGALLRIEAVKHKGKGTIETTGNIGHVLEESIKVALSYIKQKEYSKVDFNDLDIHIHLLEGAIKKEGPSCGVSITTVLLSLLLNKKIKGDIAFTGEISLTGDILKVGGIKEKLIAAYNAKIKTVYIPLANENDLKSIPEIILNKLNIILVDNYEEIYNKLFK